MTDGFEQEHPRVDEEARRTARESEQRARAQRDGVVSDSDRVANDAATGEEALRQLGLIYAGLIGVAVVMSQPFLSSSSLDTPARISILAFSIAIPLLAALVLVNRQELYRGRRTTSVIVAVAQVIAQLAAFVGIVAGFWHIAWVAGVTFLVAACVAVGVHSAGYWRLEAPLDPTSSDR